MDGGLTIQVWPHDRSQPIKDLAAVLGQRPSGQAFAQGRRHRPLSSLDWRIIDALVDDPRRPLKVLSESTGLSPKTVRKHLEGLVRGEIIFITPRLGALTDPGEFVYTFAVFGRVTMGELRRLMGDVFLVNRTLEPPMRYLLCRSADLADVTTKTHLVSKLPGVKSVFVTLNREFLVGTEFMHSLSAKEFAILVRGECNSVLEGEMKMRRPDQTRFVAESCREARICGATPRLRKPRPDPCAKALRR